MEPPILPLGGARGSASFVVALNLQQRLGVMSARKFLAFSSDNRGCCRFSDEIEKRGKGLAEPRDGDVIETFIGGEVED